MRISMNFVINILVCMIIETSSGMDYSNKNTKDFKKSYSSIFITREKASQFILSRPKRFNSKLLEEIRPGNIERECLEEVCSREEAREAFEDEALTEAFWRVYNDPNNCKPNPCNPQNTDRCEDLIGNYTCHCNPGYTGRNCQQEIGVCHSQPCVNGGTCESTGPSSYICHCSSGFRGRTCSINIDDCVQSNCGPHGDCVDRVNSFSCRCDAGFAGSTCDININECASNPCQNGGNCTDHVNFYTCQCPNQFNGKNCHLEVDPCRVNPCLRGGFCEVAPNLTFQCLCPRDYTGKICEHSVESICTSAPCKNEGTCYEIRNNVTDELNPNYPNVPQEFGCACAVGFTGHACEEKVSPCLLDDTLCPYNSTCVALDEEYICVCPEGYTGDMCQHQGGDPEALERLRCSENSCSNGARCLFYQNKTTCICRPGFQGLRCEFSANHCSNNPCINNGECLPVPSGFYCNCAQGFRGKYCEEDIDECSLENTICQNRATCVNSKGSFQCLCGPYHTGRFCEHPFDPCELDPCANGATCDRETAGYICDCLQGFGGRNCDRIIDPCTEITNPCSPKANCSINPELPYEAICSCPSRLYGRFCQKKIDNCAVKSNITALVNGEIVHQLVERKDCGANGDCAPTDDGFKCDCLLGYEGERCEKVFVTPVVNCTTENCRCPSDVVEEVRMKTNSSLQCQYRQYTKGICKSPTCLTSGCFNRNEVHECVWVSECLTSYLNEDAMEKHKNFSFSCHVMEIVLNRTQLHKNTTVEYFCDDVRGLPSYQRFANVALVHCSLLYLNDDNCSLAVSVDSITSQQEAFLLASDMFQTLEQELGKDSDSSLDPSFSAIMEIRYAGSTGHPLRTTGQTTQMTSPTPQNAPTDSSSAYLYVIIAILILIILGCAVFCYFYVTRKRHKSDALVSYVANTNPSPDDLPDDDSSYQVRVPAVARTKRKSKKSQSANGFANPGFVTQTKCNALTERHNVESNPYVSMPYATMEASPRSSSASEETRRSVEASTIDYGMMRNIPEVHESNQYELMSSFPSTSDVSRSTTVNDDTRDYAFALENQVKANNTDTTANGGPKKGQPGSTFTNEYEEITVKEAPINDYEVVQPFSSSVYANMRNSPTFKLKSNSSPDDTPYNFAFEIPSIGVPSSSPTPRAATIAAEPNTTHEPTYSNVAPPRGNFQNQTMPTRSTPNNFPSSLSHDQATNNEPCYSKISKQSPVFLTNPGRNAFFPNKNTDLPIEAAYSNP